MHYLRLTCFSLASDPCLAWSVSEGWCMPRVGPMLACSARPEFGPKQACHNGAWADTSVAWPAGGQRLTNAPAVRVSRLLGSRCYSVEYGDVIAGNLCQAYPRLQASI